VPIGPWARGLGDPDWFRARRLEALAALGKLERSSNREEAWRFTDPKRAGLDRHQVLRSSGDTDTMGTSMAAGVVSGVVALMIDASRTNHPGTPLTPNAIRSLIRMPVPVSR